MNVLKKNLIYVQKQQDTFITYVDQQQSVTGN